MIRSRDQNGSMMIVMVLTIAIIIAVGMSGFTLNGLFYQYGRAQVDADAMALRMAGELNASDRVGQINELEECSRELTYVSRKQLDSCSEEGFGFLSPLCQQLASEARYGHMLVEKERRNQIDSISRKVRETASNANNIANKRVIFSLPWLLVREPRIEQVDVGYIDKVQSNVKSMEAIKELAEFDLRNGLVDPVTKLYKPNINASLPIGDSDQRFCISSLPACVDRACAPARNTNPGVFVSTGTVFLDGQDSPGGMDQIPNAVQVSYSMNLSFGLHPDHETAVKLISTGSTYGAVAGAN